MCEVEVAQNQYHNLENRNMPRFFQHQRILPKCIFAEDEQKPKPVSAHPPNIQTLNQKRKLLLLISS